MTKASKTPRITPTYQALLDSDRISGRTRHIMEEREQTDDTGYEPRHLSPVAYKTLRALVSRVLPQASILQDSRIDLAARLDARLGSAGDGWRFASLPPDKNAYESALVGLHELSQDRHHIDFGVLTADQKDALIRSMAEGTLSTSHLTGAQMFDWFSDLRADAVQLFISHPAVQARLGIDAVFNGGDGFFQGFTIMGEGADEPWEPEETMP